MEPDIVVFCYHSLSPDPLFKVGLVCVLLLFHLYRSSRKSHLETISPPEAEAATVHVSDDLISKRDIETASIDVRGQVEESEEVSNKR